MGAEARFDFGELDATAADLYAQATNSGVPMGGTLEPAEKAPTFTDWAAKDPDGKLVVWSSTQTPHYLHRALAKAPAGAGVKS